MTARKAAYGVAPHVTKVAARLPIADDLAKAKSETCTKIGRTGTQTMRNGALAFWRTFPAHAIDSERKAALALYPRLAAAIDERFDAAMTDLLRSALEDPAAALVLSYMLRAAPIEPRKRARLATSWLARNLERAARRSRVRRQIHIG